MASNSRDNLVTASVAEASTETPHDFPHITQPDIQQESKEDNTHGSHDGTTPSGELRLPPPKSMLSTEAPSRTGITGNADNRDGRQSDKPPHNITLPGGSEVGFDFQDAQVPFDVCFL